MSDQIPPDGTGKDVEVLVVEDDEERRCLLTRLLQGHGYAATGACRANRHVVDEHAARYLALAERRDTLLGLICLDLARFKEINDRCHPGGDTVLVEVARRLEAGAREGDVVGRVGVTSSCSCFRTWRTWMPS